MPNKENHSPYSLGSSEEEQSRLMLQSQLYGDKKYLTFNKSDTVCEVGCGSGANLEFALTLTQGEYIGIDVQQAQIEAAQDRAITLGLKNTKFICADAANIPLASDSVDATFCRLVLIHLPSLSQPSPVCLSVFHEMYRITRAGGKLMVIEPDISSYESSKPSLNKCFQARVKSVYTPSKGTMNISLLLPLLFEAFGLGAIKSVEHIIDVSGKNPKKLSDFYYNWLVMNKSMKCELIAEGHLAEQDYQEAEREVLEINETDFLRQKLWYFEGVKEKSGHLSFDELVNCSDWIQEKLA